MLQCLMVFASLILLNIRNSFLNNLLSVPFILSSVVLDCFGVLCFVVVVVYSIFSSSSLVYVHVTVGLVWQIHKVTCECDDCRMNRSFDEISQPL